MTTKLLVRQGGGAAVEVDYATAFSGRKGTPFFEANAPLLQMGQRFANGECAQGFFKFVDPEAELPSDGLRLRPWCEVRLTDDASGDELTLAWMRLVAGEARRRQSYIGGAEIEHNPQMMDCNLDLRGIPLPNEWHRDAETDEDRLTALQARKLNGSASTEPSGIIRDTTDITIADVGAGHLCDFSSPTDLDARNYPEGTEVVDIISEIAEQAGKIFGVVLHHSGGSTHKCLLYIDQDDLTTWTSDVRISDDPADWDPDDATAPTFPPHWMQGAGKELDYTTTIQGLISIWSGRNDDPRTVYVETGNAPEDAEVWVGVYNDGESTSEVQATRRANWILTDRDRPYASNRVSILVKAAQAHLVTAGQAIETKSVVMESGNLQDTFVWRRVAECKIEPAADGLYWLHMSLERPRLSRRASGGPAQPKSTAAKPASPRYIETDATWRGMLHATLADGVVHAEPANWKEVGYDDSVSPWQDPDTGSYSGGHPEITTLEIDTDGDPTDYKRERELFFRREYFIKADELTGSDVVIDGFFDDGGEVFVNGSSVYVQGTPFTAAGGLFSDTVPRSAFQEGLNCIGIYAWNQGAGSDGAVPPGPVACAVRIAIDAADLNLGGGETGEVLPEDSTVHASLIPITDLGGYYGSGNVEGALQEAAAAIAAIDTSNFLTTIDGGGDVVSIVAAAGAAETLDLANGNVHDVTLTADLTVTLTSPAAGAGRWMTVFLRQDGTGGWDVTWPGSVSWSGGSAPTIDPDPNAVTIVTLVTLDGGTTWFGSAGGGGSALTVEDEGTPLATFAETLDFVGAGVTASGAGTEKTITISGAPTGAAGGDLSGTYPNPSVVDDSHSHTGATVGGVGKILITDTPAGSPLIFGDLLQNDDGTDLLYADI